MHVLSEIKVLRTEVRQSTIPNAGLGLFLMENAKEGDRVAIFSGDVLTAQQSSKSSSAYRLQINKNTILDARNKNHAVGRYMNDGPRANRPANVRYSAARCPSTCKQTGRKYVSVFAKHNIKVGINGTELLLCYGRSYKWGCVNVSDSVMKLHRKDVRG